MLLAGDIGGTKTLLGLFEPDADRPRPRVVRTFATLMFEDLPSMIVGFFKEAGLSGEPIEAACFGVAGPVLGDTAALTNAPWRVDAGRVATGLRIPRVQLLNDVQCMALAVPALQPIELHTLQEGEALRDGNMALVAPGTGLGEALLHNIGGRLVPSPSEGGNADFAARTEREIVLLRYLTAQFGRARVEHVLSGPCFVHIHRAMHEAGCSANIDLDAPDAPAAISAAAARHACRTCEETLELFVEALGAEAGNLALRTVSTGGIFIGGGIPPKILPALADGVFMRAFRAKAPLDAMLARVPVKVIMNAEAGLMGAAMCAARA